MEPPELGQAKARAQRALFRVRRQNADRAELDDAISDLNDEQGKFNDTVITETDLPPVVTEAEVLDGFADVERLLRELIALVRQGMIALFVAMIALGALVLLR